jgi:hypothetical protein
MCVNTALCFIAIVCLVPVEEIGLVENKLLYQCVYVLC